MRSMTGWRKPCGMMSPRRKVKTSSELLWATATLKAEKTGGGVPTTATGVTSYKGAAGGSNTSSQLLDQWSDSDTSLLRGRPEGKFSRRTAVETTTRIWGRWGVGLVGVGAVPLRGAPAGSAMTLVLDEAIAKAREMAEVGVTWVNLLPLGVALALYELMKEVIKALIVEGFLQLCRGRRRPAVDQPQEELRPGGGRRRQGQRPRKREFVHGLRGGGAGHLYPGCYRIRQSSPEIERLPCCSSCWPAVAEALPADEE